MGKQEKPKEEMGEMLIRIFGYDIPGSKNVYAGLTRIKGVSWSISHALCINLGIGRKKVSELSKADISKIEEFLKKLPVPDYFKNRRADISTGKTTHLYGSDLELSRDFDIKRLRKIKSYKGYRHAQGQPVRGQRTRSHFRKKKIVKAGRTGKRPMEKQK